MQQSDSKKNQDIKILFEMTEAANNIFVNCNAIALQYQYPSTSHKMLIDAVNELNTQISLIANHIVQSDTYKEINQLVK